MTIAPDLVAQILRLHAVEKWRVGTIARQLHVHRDAVRRVLAGNCAPVHTSPLRPSRIDPYRPFILQTLAKFPTLTAARLHAMVAERGFVGAGSHFRFLIAGMRPRPRAEAYLRLRTLAGEQAQVDWAHFGHLQIGRARRPLMAFVMVLSHSRMVFLRFFLDARMDSFLRGHVEAFSAFNGCSRVVLYDNLKSAVLERQGDAIRFNPALLSLAAHYRFEPRPVAVARGNEKGRVERAIRYARDAFYLSYSNRHADLLFELVSRRYQHKSTVVTTNRAFAEWGEVFPNAACVVSLIDRLMHRAEVVRIEGDSYRAKEAEEREALRKAERAKASTPRSRKASR